MLYLTERGNIAERGGREEMFDVEQEVLEEEGAPGDCVGSCQPGNVTGQGQARGQETL